MPFIPPTMIRRPRHEATGNRSLLVLADSRGSYIDTALVDETVLVALQHLGFPYRVHDLAHGLLTPQMLAGCAAAVIAQTRLGPGLTTADCRLLADAVREQGMGLVNFDGHLQLYPPAFLGLMGLEVDPIPMASDLLRIGDGAHYVCATQQPGALVRLRRPLPFAQVKRAGRHVVELAQFTMGKDQLVYARHHVPGTAYEPGQWPALLAAQCGQGRVVQFTCGPRLWHREFYGHGMGLDGLFWRAITWAARKPFVAQMMPPYVTLRVDDAIGRHGLRYAEVMNRHGHRPLISCHITYVPDHVTDFMRAAHRNQRVDWDAHALHYYKLIPFDFGIGEYDADELERIFGLVDRWFAERSIHPPKIAYSHWGEVGVRAIPYFKARGRPFLYSTYHLGQTKAERLFPNWWPYGLNSLFYDYLPEDPEMYNVGAGLPRHLVDVDVLTGCTTWAGDNPTNDLAKAAEQASLPVRYALDAGFFAEIVTHEQKFSVLSLEEIDRWLALLAPKMARHEAQLVGHELAAEYTKARDESWIVDVTAEDAGEATVRVQGASAVEQQLAVFEDDGRGVVRRWQALPAFEEEATSRV